MRYKVEIEFDKVEYDAGGGNRFPILEWLVKNCGHSIDDTRSWDSKFDYERSAPWKLLEVYSFKNSHDAILFALRWK